MHRADNEDYAAADMEEKRREAPSPRPPRPAIRMVTLSKPAASKPSRACAVAYPAAVSTKRSAWVAIRAIPHHQPRCTRLIVVLITATESVAVPGRMHQPSRCDSVRGSLAALDGAGHWHFLFVVSLTTVPARESTVFRSRAVKIGLRVMESEKPRFQLIARVPLKPRVLRNPRSSSCQCTENVGENWVRFAN